MARTKPTHPAPLFFADAFGVTAVDARGKARSKPAPFDLHGFDAKPPYLALRTAGGALSLRDAALRTLAPPLRPPGALLPERDDTLRLVTLDGARHVQLGADAAPQPVPEAPLRVALTLGVAHGPALLPVRRTPVIADDGGCALPGPDQTVWLGRLDPARSALVGHLTVALAPSRGAQYRFLPGATQHVVAALDRASDTLALAVLAPDGSIHTAHTTAIALPERAGEALWVQRDEDHVVCVSLTGETRVCVTLDPAQRGAGTVFVQHGAPWFVPWHRETIVNLTDNTVVDRALPGDPAARRHVAAVLHRLWPLARACNLGLDATSVWVRGRTTRQVYSALWADGGDLGVLAHCVQGAAFGWARWAPPPDAVASPASGGSVTAPMPATTAQLLDALAALDAHGVPLLGALDHFTTMYRQSSATAFDDDTARVFARVLVDPDLRVGAQHETARRASETPFDFEAFQAARAALRHAIEGLRRADLALRILQRHSPPGALPPTQRLVAQPALPPRSRRAP